ncbi:MAG TPA: hypothetical protein VFW59_08635, partial [Gallionella sp.]|nr:hypothetical protein [Gallionella sp.]
MNTLSTSRPFDPGTCRHNQPSGPTENLQECDSMANEYRNSGMEGRRMNLLHTTLKRIAKLGLLLTMGASMSACAGSMRWKEEVKLHDGQVVVEARYVNLGGY